MNPGRRILEDPAASDWLKKAIMKADELDIPNAALDDVDKLLEYIRWRAYDNGFLSE